MCQLIKNTITFSCFLIFVFGKFPFIRYFDIPEGTRQFEYSPSQKLLAIATDTYLLLLDGLTIALIQNISFPQPFIFKCLAFSQDQDKIAIGYKTGSEDQETAFSISINKHNSNSEAKQNLNHVPNFNFTTKFYIAYQIGQISSICILGNKNYVVLGTLKGEYMIWKSLREYFISPNMTQQISINSLACSPTSQNQFLVTFSNQTSLETTKLILYQFNLLTLTPKIIHQFNLPEQNILINSAAYSKKNNIYFVGTTKIIYKIDRKQLKITKHQLPIQFRNLTKIRVNQDENILAICSDGTTLCILQQIPDSQVILEKETKNQYYLTTYLPSYPTFALSPKGSYCSFPSQTTMAEIVSQCIEGQYILQVSHKCTPCPIKCLLCLGPDYCFECSLAYYKSENYTCEKCMDHCLLCSNGLMCQRCYETFAMSKEGICHCKKGKFIKDNLCEKCIDKCQQCTNSFSCNKCYDGFQFSKGQCIPQNNKYKIQVIILSIILGLIIITSIIVLIVYKIKRKNNKKKQQLLSNSDDGQRVHI